jgi:hypothetical protein
LVCLYLEDWIGIRRHEEVLRGHENRDGGGERAHGECDQAEAIDDHGGEFPAQLLALVLLVVLDLLRDLLDLAQNAIQVPLHRIDVVLAGAGGEEATTTAAATVTAQVIVARHVAVLSLQVRIAAAPTTVRRVVLATLLLLLIAHGRSIVGAAHVQLILARHGHVVFVVGGAGGGADDEVVVDVEHVGEQTLGAELLVELVLRARVVVVLVQGGRLLARLLLPLLLLLVAGYLHAEQSSQVVANEHFDLFFC